jgi:hypothetical protein
MLADLGGAASVALVRVGSPITCGCRRPHRSTGPWQALLSFARAFSSSPFMTKGFTVMTGIAAPPGKRLDALRVIAVEHRQLRARASCYGAGDKRHGLPRVACVKPWRRRGDAAGACERRLLGV